MKAMTLMSYGSLDALRLMDVPEAPAPGPGEVLVDVVAASVNAADGYVVRGRPFPIRLAIGLRRPGIVAVGADAAGRVLAVGAGVTAFKPGDEVMADLSGCGFGAFAQRVCAPARAWAPKPARFSMAEAACVPMAGMTAFKGLRDVARVRAGERVLVVGAAGGVGSFAVAFARALGAEVTASCAAAKADAVRRLGASDVVAGDALDAALDLDAWKGRFDVVFDCAAYRTVFRFNRVLRRGGRYVCVGGAIGRLMQTGLLGPLVGLLTGRRYALLTQQADGAFLGEVLAFMEQHGIRPHVDRAFALRDVALAMRHVEERKASGKVVITVGL